MMRVRGFIVLVAAVLTVAGCGAPTAPDGGAPPPDTPDGELPPEFSRLYSLEARAKRAAGEFRRCMADRGWEVVEQHDGSFAATVPEDRRAAYDADVAACEKESGLSDLPPLAVTVQQAEQLYGYLLEVADCVRDLGYPVPDPPDRQEFVDQLVATSISPWHPYRGAAAAGGMLEVEARCPVPDWP